MWLDKEGFWIKDLESTNGTFVNGARIAGFALLRIRDLVEMGHTFLQLQV